MSRLVCILCEISKFKKMCRFNCVASSVAGPKSDGLSSVGIPEDDVYAVLPRTTEHLAAYSGNRNNGGFQRTLLKLAGDRTTSALSCGLALTEGRFEHLLYLWGHLTDACSSVHALRNFLYLILISNCTLERLWAVTFVLCTRLTPAAMHGTERPRALMEHDSKERKIDVRRSRNVIPILACHWAALLGVHRYSITFSHTFIHSPTHSFIHPCCGTSYHRSIPSYKASSI